MDTGRGAGDLLTVVGALLGALALSDALSQQESLALVRAAAEEHAHGHH
ncbi:hypothetical protein ABZ016_03580 [Streptomyces sp. NPDC006372]